MDRGPLWTIHGARLDHRHVFQRMFSEHRRRAFTETQELALDGI